LKEKITNRADKSGTIKQAGEGLMKSYVKRYLMIEKGEFKLFKSEKDNEPFITANLKNCSIEKPKKKNILLIANNRQ
jgi:hypothetical protein